MEINFTKVFMLLDENKNAEAKKYLLSIDFEQLDIENKFKYLNSFGYVLCELKEFDEAHKNYKTFLDMSINLNNKEKEHIAYHQLAMVERLNSKYNSAYQYIEKESEIIHKHFPNDVLKLAINQYEKGYLNFKMGDTDNAKLSMQASLNYALKTDDEVAKACAYRGLGEIYKNENKSLSDKNFDMAYKIFLDLDDKIGAKEVLELKLNQA